MTKFNANTVQEFMAAARKKFGGQDLGLTHAHPEAAWSFNNKTNKLFKVAFTCPITEDFAQVGGGKPDKANKDAIKEVADRAKAHEDQHKADYLAAFNKFDADTTAKNLMAQTYKDVNEAKKAVHAKREELATSLKNACLALHKTEGVLTVTQKKDGTFDVAMQAAGANGCDQITQAAKKR
jgi:hypothetical protein